MKKLFLLLLAIGLVVLTQSCKKDSGEDPNPPEGIEALQIPDGFLFETTREIELTVILPASVSFETSGYRFDVYHRFTSEGEMQRLFSSFFLQMEMLQSIYKFRLRLHNFYEYVCKVVSY